MRQEGLISVTNKNFGEEVIQSDLPVLVDFWAWVPSLSDLQTRCGRGSKRVRKQDKGGKVECC